METNLDRARFDRVGDAQGGSESAVERHAKLDALLDCGLGRPRQTPPNVFLDVPLRPLLPHRACGRSRGHQRTCRVSHGKPTCGEVVPGIVLRLPGGQGITMRAPRAHKGQACKAIAAAVQPPMPPPTHPLMSRSDPAYLRRCACSIRAPCLRKERMALLAIRARRREGGVRRRAKPAARAHIPGPWLLLPTARRIDGGARGPAVEPRLWTGKVGERSSPQPIERRGTAPSRRTGAAIEYRSLTQCGRA